MFANRKRSRIARLLDELGVQQIEAGVPVMAEMMKRGDQAHLPTGLKASIMAGTRHVN